jgi:hypothetical protein
MVEEWRWMVEEWMWMVEEWWGGLRSGEAIEECTCMSVKQ